MRLRKEDWQMSKETEVKSKAISELNDKLRSGDQTVQGQVLFTHGIVHLSIRNDEWSVAALMKKVADFDQFTNDNDPHDEHDFGAFEHEGRKVFWKIDCYAPDMLHGSEDPSDNKQTVRVLTVMLAEEY